MTSQPIWVEISCSRSMARFLPTPSWKAVVEVHDAQKMEQTLESVTDFIRTMVAQDKDQDKDKSLKGLQIESSEVDSQRFYAIRNLGTRDHHCSSTPLRTVT